VPTRRELKELAVTRLREAEILFAARHYSGAAKARICKLLGTEEYPDSGKHLDAIRDPKDGIPMDQEILVTDLKKLYHEIDRRFGPVALMMLVAPDPFSESDWTLLIGARGFDELTRGEAIRKVVDLLSESFHDENWQRIFRVDVLRTDDAFVRGMNRVFASEESILNIHAAVVSGVEIPKAIVLQSKAAA
jgi:hypothetical protein